MLHMTAEWFTKL